MYIFQIVNNYFYKQCPTVCLTGDDNHTIDFLYLFQGTTEIFDDEIDKEISESFYFIPLDKNDDMVFVVVQSDSENCKK